MVRRLTLSCNSILCMKENMGDRVLCLCVYVQEWKKCVCELNQKIIRSGERAFLVVQWLRIHLAMQKTRVQSLVQENSTCHRRTKPV